MKILSAPQISACDAYTIQASGIAPDVLMERAATKCVSWIREHFPKGTLFIVLCGTGNNGGDGLAITRLLHQQGFGVKAFVLRFTDSFSNEAKSNLSRLKLIDESLVAIAAPGAFLPDIPAHFVVIDALLGTGISRPATGWLADFVAHINALPNTKIAIDMPSGLPADILPDSGYTVLKADHTLSFQFYKRSFMHAEAAQFTGNVHLLDIGLNTDFINAAQTIYRTTDQNDIAAIYRRRSQFGHKGTYGSAFLVGGSFGSMGAITLAAKGALRAGAGRVTSLVPGCGYAIMQTTVPEAMCLTSGEAVIEHISGWEAMTAVGIGPGMGTDPRTGTALAEFLELCKKPMVADADALNLIAKQPDLLKKLPSGAVITPHPKEFSRLFGDNTNSMIQTDNARIQAMRYNICIVLKGHHTVVITPEGDCWYNTTGNAGMATGGAGDVLTGVITGLLAQGYPTAQAAVLGVYLHGLAGDIAAQSLSEEALTASDIAGNIGNAFLTLY